MGPTSHRSSPSPTLRRSRFLMFRRSSLDSVVPSGLLLSTWWPGRWPPLPPPPCALSMSTVARRMDSFLGPHGRFDVRKSYAASRLGKSWHQNRYPMATPGERPMPAVQWQYTVWPSRKCLSSAATALGMPVRSPSASKSGTGWRESSMWRSPIRHLMSSALTPQYALSLSCCESKMHVTPSTSCSRSMSLAFRGWVPTIKFGRMEW
mmetsp:Transcript_18397/g.45762  ORF Transcript_18397/g.45762 Transcript_18397/m.45762 type:complete len:207 (+) Transcript_18397:127-747(+)